MLFLNSMYEVLSYRLSFCWSSQRWRVHSGLSVCKNHPNRASEQTWSPVLTEERTVDMSTLSDSLSLAHLCCGSSAVGLFFACKPLKVSDHKVYTVSLKHFSTLKSHLKILECNCIKLLNIKQIGADARKMMLEPFSLEMFQK